MEKIASRKTRSGADYLERLVPMNVRVPRDQYLMLRLMVRSKVSMSALVRRAVEEFLTRRLEEGIFTTQPNPPEEQCEQP